MLDAPALVSQAVITNGDTHLRQLKRASDSQATDAVSQRPHSAGPLSRFAPQAVENAIAGHEHERGRLLLCGGEDAGGRRGVCGLPSAADGDVSAGLSEDGLQTTLGVTDTAANLHDSFDLHQFGDSRIVRLDPAD